MLNPNLNLGGTVSLANTSVIAGTTSTYTTGAASVHVIDGKFGTALAAQTNTASPTTDATTGTAFVALADDEACTLVFGVNLAGAIQLSQGAKTNIEPGTTTLLITPPFPSLPNDFCPIGYAIIKNDSGSAFTTGTTSWSAIDSTFVDVAMMPDRPQAS
tara:strand:+ start:8486 stop:8962 length:477 start_codon:yes stop_codon:yes gene_type:complete